MRKWLFIRTHAGRRKSCKTVTRTPLQTNGAFKVLVYALALSPCLSSTLAHAQSSAFPTTAKTDPSEDSWRQAMMNTPTGGTGCFVASPPDTKWTATPCIPTLQVPSGLQPMSGSPKAGKESLAQPESAGAGVVGNGNDYFAVPQGKVDQAVGTFNHVNVSSVSGFSIQINTNSFAPTSLCNGHSGCIGWQQFMYSNSTATGGKGGAVFIEWTLFNYGTTCPSPAWGLYGGTTCFLNISSPANMPTLSITSLSGMNLTGMDAGTNCPAGEDEVTFRSGNGTLYTNCQNSIGLSSSPTGWTTTEFGVYGDMNNSQAQFNSGATVGDLLRLTTTKPGAPTCTTNANIIFTTETTNLTLIPDSCCPFNNGNNVGGISFLESNASPLPGTSFCLLTESVPINSLLLQ
jgi:hypothetical protein